MKVGILAMQGDYDAHRSVLERLGVNSTLVRTPEQLDHVAGLIIPGGESSAFLKLLSEREFFEDLKSFVIRKPALGTCAGAILLAKEVVGPQQLSLGALDVRIRRNAYGRQIHSSIRKGVVNGRSFEMVLIRAPKIERLGDGVEVLGTEGDDTVLVREGKVMAATFHPELTDDTRVHEAFLELITNSGSA
jgi:5'-phosphate synthase pdxT subunit